MQGCARVRAPGGRGARGTGLAGQADAPEPSPLFWDAFRRRVARRDRGDAGAAVAASAVGGRALAASADLAAVLTLVPGSAPARRRPDRRASLPAWSPLPPADDDPALPAAGEAAPAMAASAASSSAATWRSASRA